MMLFELISRFLYNWAIAYGPYGIAHTIEAPYVNRVSSGWQKFWSLRARGLSDQNKNKFLVFPWGVKKFKILVTQSA
jgi:hypothetical protein